MVGAGWSRAKTRLSKRFISGGPPGARTKCCGNSCRVEPGAAKRVLMRSGSNEQRRTGKHTSNQDVHTERRCHQHECGDGARPPHVDDFRLRDPYPSKWHVVEIIISRVSDKKAGSEVPGRYEPLSDPRLINSPLQLIVCWVHVLHERGLPTIADGTLAPFPFPSESCMADGLLSRQLSTIFQYESFWITCSPRKV